MSIKKIKTQSLAKDGKSQQYAKVTDRIKEFRSANPYGLIETTPNIQPDGTVLFKARILSDKSNLSSGEAIGHAMGEFKGVKAFEKLETIAIGRALAFLGYAADGEIASSEEMEEFQLFQQDKMEKALEEASDAIKAAKTLEMLKGVWSPLPADIKTALVEIKDKKKNELSAIKKPKNESPV